MMRLGGIVFVALLAGCGSSGSGEQEKDPTSCDAAIALSGGVSASVDANFCSGGGSAFSIGQSDGLSASSKSTSVSFDLGRDLGEDEIGVVPVVSAKVRVRNAGVEEAWEAGAGACEINLTSRAKSSIGLHYGTGTARCTQDLTAVAPNVKPPVKIAQFSFTAIVPGP